jgi:hypothetical protein
MINEGKNLERAIMKAFSVTLKTGLATLALNQVIHPMLFLTETVAPSGGRKTT